MGEVPTRVSFRLPGGDLELPVQSGGQVTVQRRLLAMGPHVSLGQGRGGRGAHSLCSRDSGWWRPGRGSEVTAESWGPHKTLPRALLGNMGGQRELWKTSPQMTL